MHGRNQTLKILNSQFCVVQVKNRLNLCQICFANSHKLYNNHLDSQKQFSHICFIFQNSSRLTWTSSSNFRMKKKLISCSSGQYKCNILFLPLSYSCFAGSNKNCLQNRWNHWGWGELNLNSTMRKFLKLFIKFAQSEWVVVQGVPELSVPKQTLVTFLFFT